MNDYTKDKSCRSKSSGLMGAAILITLGVLFTLQNFTRFDFGETWPVLLIVIGVFSYLKRSAPATDYSQPYGPQATVPPPPAAAVPPQQHDSQVNP
jgi:Domain of unknown function (DUF5668)